VFRHAGFLFFYGRQDGYLPHYFTFHSHKQNREALAHPDNQLAFASDIYDPKSNLNVSLIYPIDWSGYSFLST
jgi:hypothetical protein